MDSSDAVRLSHNIHHLVFQRVDPRTHKAPNDIDAASNTLLSTCIPRCGRTHWPRQAQAVSGKSESGSLASLSHESCSRWWSWELVPAIWEVLTLRSKTCASLSRGALTNFLSRVSLTSFASVWIVLSLLPVQHQPSLTIRLTRAQAVMLHHLCKEPCL